MKPHKKTLLAAACAAGLMIGGCQSDPWADLGNPDECEELTNGGVLDCEDEKGEPCKLELNECTYYRLGKCRVIVDLGYGHIYQRPYAVGNYNEHSPARRETENSVAFTPASTGLEPPESVGDLFGAVHLRVSIFDTETKKWSYSEFAMYRAWVSPEVTYKNTVWGRVRKQGAKTYAWHVLPWKEAEAYRRFYKYPDGRFSESEFGKRIENWSLEKPINWQPGEKEAHDALAEEVSLRLPLAENWEAYDLNFIFEEVYHSHVNLKYREHLESFPEHLRRSFTQAEYDTTDLSDGFLEFKIRRR